MRKVLLAFLSFMLFVPFMKAECTYKAQVELNKLANYVESRYEYDSSSAKFNVIFNNVPKELYIMINDNEYTSNEEGEVTINNFSYGEVINAKVYSSRYTECADYNLRSINIKLPYFNSFYNSDDCYGHESLDVCSYQLLPYEVDSDTFYRLIRNDKKKPTETEKQEEIEEDKNTLLDIGLDYGVPIILIIVSSLIAISVGNIIYRKQKHGI